MTSSRRKFLQGLSSFGAIPLLGSSAFASRVHAAGDVASPLRLITLFSPHGTIYRRWKPRAMAGSNPESNFDINYEGSILAPLQAFKDKMLILDGIDYRVLYDTSGTGHEGGMATALTGAASTGTGPEAASCEKGSIDQYIANHIGQQDPLKSLSLALGMAGGSHVSTTLNYAAGGQALPSMNNPSTVFNRLLNIKESALSSDAVLAKRSLMLGFLTKDINRLKARANTKGKEILDIHLDSVQKIAASFSQNGSINPACSLGESPNSLDISRAENHPQIVRQQIDLMVEAMYCGITKVSSLRMHRAGSGTPMPFLGLNGDVHHDIAHAIPAREDLNATSFSTAEEQLTLIQRWYAQQVAYLMESLASRPEGDGTMLDNTVILWTNELGNASIHGNLNVPMMVLGGAQGKFRMGRWLQFSQDQRPDCTNYFAIDKCPGEAPSSRQTAHNHVLISILRAFGLNDTTFGHESFSGPLEAMF